MLVLMFSPCRKFAVVTSITPFGRNGKHNLSDKAKAIRAKANWRFRSLFFGATKSEVIVGETHRDQL